jgi:hypothetical protein
MTLEDTLSGWTGPSSDSEQEKQERTERMVREAIAEHAELAKCGLQVYAKGSYANNTNVRADSDVDIAVECCELFYWGERAPGNHGVIDPYRGSWNPQKLRGALVSALETKFPGKVDSSGSAAIRVHSNTARVDADVVPCFSYRLYSAPNEFWRGTKIYREDGKELVNYPNQQLELGRAKNVRTGYTYKRTVRILKRLENAMAEAKTIKPLPSYFMECLGYNCPDSVFANATWVEITRAALLYIWSGLEGEEPNEAGQRWLEANECIYLFHDSQAWTRAAGRNFAGNAWNYLGLK